MKLNSLNKELSYEGLKQKQHTAYLDSMLLEYGKTTIVQTKTKNQEPILLKKFLITDTTIGKEITYAKNNTILHSNLLKKIIKADSIKPAFDNTNKVFTTIKKNEGEKDSSSSTYKFSSTAQVNLNQYQTIVAENVEMLINLKYGTDGKIKSGSVIPKLVMLDQVSEMKELKSLTFTSVARGITEDNNIDFIFREYTPVDKNMSELDPRNYDKQLVVELTGNINDVYIDCNIHWVDIGGRPLKNTIKLKVN